MAWLPDRLPSSDDLIWAIPLSGPGVGGLMVAGDVVVVSGRDSADQRDLFVALDLDTGHLRWRHSYPATASLDYGNSPRATPALSQGVIVTLGATGMMVALDASSGVPLWSKSLSEEFQVPVPTWGFCSSPLIIDENVLVQVADDPAVLSLDLFTGNVLWSVSGEPAGYSSLVPMPGDSSLAGVGSEGYFTIDLEDGETTWSMKPEYSGDFGVPAPVLTEAGLIFSSENNGIQLIPFRGDRLAIDTKAVNDELIPDSHTPVAVGARLLVAHDGLHCLSLENNLQETWCVGSSLIRGYASIIASQDRALVTTGKGDMLLVSLGDGVANRLLDQKKLAKQNVSVLSHPAVVKDLLLVRVGNELRCYRL